MCRYILHTYDSLDEYDKRYSELEGNGSKIHLFNHEVTHELLYEDPDVTIDISALVEAIPNNLGLVQNGIYNLKDLDDNSEVIIRSELAEQAMQFFYGIFDEIKPLYETENIDEDSEYESEDSLLPFNRKILYTYENQTQLNTIINFVNEKEIPFTNFARYNGIDRENFNLLSVEKKKALIDITTLIDVIIEKPENIFVFEQAMQYLPHYDAIILYSKADEALNSFNFIFSDKKPIFELLDGIEFPSIKHDEQVEEKNTKKIDSESIELIKEMLTSQLIGHNEFKKQFKEALDDFLILNSLGVKKIFSVFLLGNSGLGKTEVARIINKALNKDKQLIKINFGNYSSDNALNSLIGSPRGYIGSEEGELSLKIKNNATGIILCDEFEKATFPVYNFFLELLEDGVFTDSQSIEYDLDGFIIIFTSNINEYQFYERIPKELQSRLDLVCDFKELNIIEKKEYVDFQIKTFLESIQSKIDISWISEEDYTHFKEIDINYMDNLRDIKRLVQKRILEKIKEHQT